MIAQEVAALYKLDPWEWIDILSKYTTAERLRIALPILQKRHGHLRFTHRQLAEVVCSSREKVTLALGLLKQDGTVKYDNRRTYRPEMFLSKAVS